MSQDFYDKVAKKFGGYGYGNGHKPIYKSEYPAGNPEKIFKEKILELSSKDKIASVYFRGRITVVQLALDQPILVRIQAPELNAVK